MNFIAKVIGWGLLGLVGLSMISIAMAVFIPSLSQRSTAELDAASGGWSGEALSTLAVFLPSLALAGILAFGFVSILRWNERRSRGSGFAKVRGALIVGLGTAGLAFLTFVYIHNQPNPSRVWEDGAVVIVDPSSEQLIGWKLAGIPLGFLWLVLFYGLVSLFRMPAASQSAEDDEEIHLMQQIHSGLGRMETRVDSLETILVDAEKESPVR